MNEPESSCKLCNRPIVDGKLHWHHMRSDKNPATELKARCLYRGLKLTVYTHLNSRDASWQVRAEQEGVSPELPAAEWDICVTGVAKGETPEASEQAACLAAEHCAEVLLGAIGIVEMSRNAGAKEAAFWRTLRAAPKPDRGSVAALLLAPLVKP